MEAIALSPLLMQSVIYHQLAILATNSHSKVDTQTDRSSSNQPIISYPQRMKTQYCADLWWQMTLFANNVVMYTHRAINTGKDTRQAGQILFGSKCFNNCWVSGEKLESAKEVNQQLMMDDIIYTLTCLHNHVCKQTYSNYVSQCEWK